MTERVQRFFAVQAEQDSDLGPRQVRLRASTEALGRDRLSVVTRGIDVGPYQTNPIILFQHKRDAPVARATDVSIENDALTMLAEFAPEGISETADETCGLVKAGILNGISCSFDILEKEPINPRDRSAGSRVTRSELLEVSFVTVPAERNSLVTERADGEDESGHVGFVSVAPELVVSALAVAAEEREAEPAVERAGAKFSAVSKSKMREVAGHLDTMAACHSEAMRCLREMMDEEDRDMDEGGDEMRSAEAMLGHPTPQKFSEALAQLGPITPAERFRRQLALRTCAA